MRVACVEYIGFQKTSNEERLITCNIPVKLAIDFLFFSQKQDDPDSIFFNPRVKTVRSGVVTFGFRPSYKGSNDTAKEQIIKILSEFAGKKEVGCKLD